MKEQTFQGSVFLKGEYYFSLSKKKHVFATKNVWTTNHWNKQFCSELCYNV